MAEDTEVMEVVGSDEGQDDVTVDVDVSGFSEAELEKIVSGSTSKEDDDADTEPDADNTNDDAASSKDKRETVDAPEPELSIEALREKVASLESEVIKRDTRLTQQEKFIQARNNEVGGLRQQLDLIKSMPTYTTEQIQDLAITDPDAAVQALQQKVSNDSEAQRIEARIRTVELDRTLREHHPDIEEIFPELVKLVDEDNPGTGLASQFASNPFMFGLATVHNLAHRAKTNLKLASLEAQVELLKREKSEIAKDTIKKINEAAKKKKSMAAGTGSAQENDSVGVADMDMSKWTPEQLQHVIKHGKLPS